MKVSVVRGGGLAGVVEETSLDADALDEEHAQALTSLAERVRTISPGESGEPGPEHPDAASLMVTIDDGSETRSITVADDDLPEAVRELVELVGRSDARTQTFRAPGPS